MIQVWSLRAKRGELPAALCELLRPGFDRSLSVVRADGHMHFKKK
jgi:hypothetical protein